MDDDVSLTQTFEYSLAGIKRVLRTLDAKERTQAQAVVALQRRLDANPAAAARADWDQLGLLRMRLDGVQTLRLNLRAQLLALAERPFLD